MRRVRDFACVVLAMALTGSMPCGSLAEDRTSELVIARHLDFNSLDPHRAFCESCRIFNANVYETLITLDDNNQLAPLLAHSWSSNEDQTEFSFSLASNALFSDGTPVEARDVKWSLERLKRLGAHASFMMSTVSSIEAPDPRTIVIKTTRPYSEFLNLATSPYMAIVNSDVAISKGACSDQDASSCADGAAPWFQQNTAGSGPYRLVSYSPGVELRLERNENYWREAPVIRQVVFREARDPAAQAKMIEDGSADLAMELNAATANRLRREGLTIRDVPSDTIIYLALSPGAKENEVALDKAVRNAFAHALDRKKLIDAVLSGRGQAIIAPIPPRFLGGSNHTIQAADLDAARELLKEAGLEGKVVLEAVFPDLNVRGVDLARLMEAVQSSMADIGIDVRAEAVPFAVWREKMNSEGIPLTAVFYDPDYFGSAQFAEYFGMIEGSVWAGWARIEHGMLNPKQATLYERVLASSPVEADALWRALAEEMIADLIIFPIVSPNRILAYRSDLSGVEYSTCCILQLARLRR